MSSPQDSFPHRVLGRLADGIAARPRLFLFPQLILFILCVVYTVNQLEFTTRRNDLVGADKRYHHNFLEFKQEFQIQDDLVVVVESEDRENNRQFVERLGARLEAATNVFSNVFYKGDLQMMGKKALWFFTEEELTEFRNTLREYKPFIQHFAEASSLNALFTMVNQQFREARQEPPADAESLVKGLPTFKRIISRATDSLQRPGTPPSPGIESLFAEGDQSDDSAYVTFADQRIYLVTARAEADVSEARAVERLRELVEETRAEVPGVNAGVTGEPVLEVDEMAQSQQDTLVASLLALGFVALIFIYGYGEIGRPIKATTCLVIGLGYTMGFTTLSIGHLNILTITFVPILIGLAIDFGVHLITRYEEELRIGKNPYQAVRMAMTYTGLGICTGCLTTSGAFFAMSFTDFKGIQEMGVITGGGMVICLIPMLTLLPALLVGRGPHPGPARAQSGQDKKKVKDKEKERDKQTDARARIENIWLSRPGWVVGVALLLSAAALTQFPNVYFDYNLLNMQSKGLPAVVYEEKLIRTADKSVLYAAVVADSLDEARRLESRLLELPAVASVDSMAGYMSPEATSKIQLIRDIKQLAGSIEFAKPDPHPVDIPELSQVLWSLRGYLGLALDDVPPEEYPELHSQLTSLRQSVNRLRKAMFSGDAQENVRKLTAFQQAMFEDLKQTFNLLEHQNVDGPLRPEDLPPFLRHRFIGQTGKHLLQVYPGKNVWEREHQKEFIEQLRTVDPDVTGTPVQLYEYTTLLKESYEQAALYALAAIVILVLIHFRSLMVLLLALVPVVAGAVWMVGLMGWRGIPFNPANIMTLPLVIGIGVTNGIHILNRFTEEQNPGILAKSTGKAVLVSALTTIAGFGSLLVAQHQGIASLGFVMSVGVATCMLAGLTFLPAILVLLSRRGWSLTKGEKEEAAKAIHSGGSVNRKP